MNNINLGALNNVHNYQSNNSYMAGTRLFSMGKSDVEYDENRTLTKTKEVKDLLRRMQQEELRKKANPYQGVSQSKENGYMQTAEANTTEEEEAQVELKYNYKEVATKIQRAKTSASAGQAVLSAKRKVLEIRRKIANKSGDPKELQLALTHAKRMEMVARKKKHHLELEELITVTRKRDEQMEEREDRIDEMRSAEVELSEEQVAQAEDAIFEEREKTFDEAVEQMEEQNMEMSDDVMSELNEMVAEIGEDELRQLEETMEMLENMEIADPHMSEEDLEKLKTKHRNSENKAIVKAEMDYLKSLVKYMTQKGGTIPSAHMSSGVSFSSPSFSVSVDSGISIGVGEGMDLGGIGGPAVTGFDIQI